MKLEAESIELTILDGGGISFQNGDELRRLVETGVLKARASKGATIRRASSKENSQAFILSQLKRRGIRDLNHYRQVVGNPRTDGMLHSFKCGSILTMERCPHPNQPEAVWYAILDTAIGATPAFIEKLAARGRIRVIAIPNV